MDHHLVLLFIHLPFSSPFPSETSWLYRAICIHEFSVLFEVFTLLLYTLRTLEFSDEEFAQECLECDEGIGDSPTRYFTNDGDVTQTSPLQYKRPIFSRSCSAPFGVPSSIHPGEGTNLKFVHQNRKVPHIKITDFSALDLEVNSSRHSG